MDDFHDEDASVTDEDTPSRNERPARATPTSTRARATAAESLRTRRKAMLGAVNQYELMRDVDSTQLALLAAVLGCDPDPATIAVWAHTTKSTDTRVADLLALRDLDPLDAMVEAISLCEDRSELRGTWALLSSLGALPETIPTRQNAAWLARQLVQAVASLDSESLSALRRTDQLIAG